MRWVALLLLVVTCGCVAKRTESAPEPAHLSTVAPADTAGEPLARTDLADEHYFRMIEASRGKSSLICAPRLVRAANALIPLGRQEALRILRAYLAHRGSPDDYFDHEDFPSRVFWVARLVFTTQSGSGLRCPGVGSFGTVVKDDSEHWSLYPLCLCEDVPFDVSAGLSLMGVAEMPAEYLDYVEESGVLRTSLLRPADNPLEAAERFFASAAWKDIRWEGKEQGHSWYISESWIRTMVRKQALEALQDIYDSGEDIWAIQSHGGKYDWDAHRQSVRDLSPRWDEELQKYVATK